MQSLGKSAVWTTATLGLLAPVSATTLNVEVTLPKFDGASVYAPYLAAWIENPEDKSNVGTLAVWYDTRMKNNLGQGWLRHLRTWWRNGGAQVSLPADGVSSATRPAGTHSMSFADAHGALAKLPAANYQLVVEVAREKGGRELLRVPLDWKGTATSAQKASAEGSGELSKLSLSVQP